MDNHYEDFIKKFDIDALTIVNTPYWVWSLRPHQATLGSSILSLKRKCESFSEISLEESEDLVKIVKIIESTLKKSFKYNKINYLMLMMVDKQLHFHVIPRYSDKKTFFNIVWEDENWPKFPMIDGEFLDMNLLQLIKNYLIESQLDI